MRWRCAGTRCDWWCGPIRTLRRGIRSLTTACPAHLVSSSNGSPAAGPQFARRVGVPVLSAGRVVGAARADVLMTRDLGMAAMLQQDAARGRAPVVYESHGYAPDVAAALPEMVTTARPPGAARLKRLAEREAAVWRDADGYVTITAGLARVLEEKFGSARTRRLCPMECA